MIKPRNLAILMQRHADFISTSRYDPTRRTCFVSYHDADFGEVESFIRQFGVEFIPRCVGVTEQDGFVGSLDEEYIKSRIRQEHLGDSTVTIVLIGRETWYQKFNDWEIAASLDDDPLRRRNGILAMPLPSLRNRAILPERIRDNYVVADNDRSYVIYESYPTTPEGFRAKIDRAEAVRFDAARQVDNSRPIRRTDAT